VLSGPVNLAGFPAIALPLPGGRSVQLIGPPNSETLLCATAAVLETAVA
jgi:Asp-tRNA(Asn)/Glu-tRNA(Gln) amidotransferase A subunit family amidase